MQWKDGCRCGMAAPGVSEALVGENVVVFIMLLVWIWLIFLHSWRSLIACSSLVGIEASWSFPCLLWYVYCCCPYSVQINLFLCVHCFACRSVYEQCVRNARGGQKREGDPLGLELQVVVNHHVSAGHGTLVLWKSSQFLKKTTLSLAPKYCVFKLRYK